MNTEPIWSSVLTLVLRISPIDLPRVIRVIRSAVLTERLSLRYNYLGLLGLLGLFGLPKIWLKAAQKPPLTQHAVAKSLFRYE